MRTPMADVTRDIPVGDCKEDRRKLEVIDRRMAELRRRLAARNGSVGSLGRDHAELSALRWLYRRVRSVEREEAMRAAILHLTGQVRVVAEQRGEPMPQWAVDLESVTR